MTSKREIELYEALDQIESALMGLGEFVELPAQWEGAEDKVVLRPALRLGQIRRVCKALAECTRIVNEPKETSNDA
jgi:hypothetical protein